MSDMIKGSIKLRTDYLDDYRLIADFPALFFTLSFSLIFVLIPFFVSDYFLHILIHIAIYSVAVLGQNILIGYTGLISFGQVGFLAVGAYVYAHLSHFGFAPAIFLSGFISALFGVLVGVPSLRLKGPYLAIITLGFSIVVFQIIQNVPEISGGRMGLSIARPWGIDSEIEIYYVAVATAFLFYVFGYRIVKSHIGRVFVAIRDSEIATETLGVNISYYKILSFVISSFYTGVSGGLYAHFLGYLEPTMFQIAESILMFSAIVIGGIGSVAGSLLGSAFVVAVPQFFVGFRELVPFIFGFAIIFVMIFEPLGLYGRWLKIKLYFMNLPFR